MKLAWDGASLCAGHPPVFAEFVDYTRGLGFDAEPDYDGWKQKFIAAASEHGGDLKMGVLHAIVNGEDLPPIPEGAPSSPLLPSESSKLPDSDDGWVPTSDWPGPINIKNDHLFGDEVGLVKGCLEWIEEPPAMESEWTWYCGPELMVGNS